MKMVFGSSGSGGNIMRDTPETPYKMIFKTGKLYELDMVASALKERGIPFFQRQETASGVRFAVTQPAMGPGVWYSVLVPEPVADDALAVLAELPVEPTTEPDVWSFGPTKEAKRGFRIYAFGMLLAVAISLIVSLIDSC
jgi:hypothetical protein